MTNGQAKKLNAGDRVKHQFKGKGEATLGTVTRIECGSDEGVGFPWQGRCVQAGCLVRSGLGEPPAPAPALKYHDRPEARQAMPHSKGKWEAVPKKQGKGFMLISRAANGVGHVKVAEIYSDADHLASAASLFPTAEESKSNALLMAASPRLLKVVERLVSEDASGEFSVGLIEDAREILAQLEGGA